MENRTMKRRIAATMSLFASLSGACDRSPSSGPSTATTAPNALPAAPLPAPIAPGEGQAASSDANPEDIVIAFDGDPVGGPSPAFEAVVGDWYVAEEAGGRGLKVDGGRWRGGQPSAGIADQAKRLYGDRYAEFLDGVKAFAFFPFAVWKGEMPKGDVRISVRFYPEAGKIDQAAGIAFAIAPDGSYLGARANALEDNILYFRVVKGRRTLIDTVRNVSTPSKTWHTLSVVLRGKQLGVELDGKRRFEKTLDAAPVGRAGLWSKADSQVLFDDFAVTPLVPPGAPP
jgi:hypothetical protein